MAVIPSMETCGGTKDLITIHFASQSQRDETIKGCYEISAKTYSISYENGKECQSKEEIVGFFLRVVEKHWVLSLWKKSRQKKNRLQENPSPLLTKLGLMKDRTGGDRHDVVVVSTVEQCEEIKSLFKEIGIEEKVE